MRKHRTASIAQMISAGLSLILVLFLLFVFYINLDLYSSYKEQEQRTRILSLLQELKNNFVQITDCLSSYLDSGSQYKLSDFYSILRTLESSWDSLNEITIYGEETFYILTSMKIALNSYAEEAEKALSCFQEQSTDMYEYLTSSELITDYLEAYTDQLLTLIIASDIGRLSLALEGQKKIMQTSAVILMMFLFFILFIRYIFRSRISLPLRKLSMQAEVLSRGNFQDHAHLPHADRDVALLSDTLNRMASDIERMMEDLKDKVKAEEQLLDEQRKNLEYEAMLNKATYLVLQTQTNPHFLYNTLNAISRTVTLGQYQNAQKMLKSLSHLMRYNLSSSDVPAILREEIEITEEYLSIQSLRFGDRVKYVINVPEEFLDTVTLPRFTFQPLVENSIIHGLEPLEHGGTIYIDAKPRGRRLVLRIADNGQGFDPRGLREQENKRIGIANTRERLKLFFHDEKAFSLASKPGKGTLIIISAGEIL